jgi:predicted small integral membrane protein
MTDNVSNEGPSKGSKTIHATLFAALATISALNYVIPSAEQKLGLVVVNTILSNSYVWNLVTASFFETSAVKLAADALALYYIFKTVNYPSVETFVQHLGVTLLSCTFSWSTYCILNYFATADATAISAPVYGFGGVLMAILTYARQGKGKESIVGNFPVAISFHNLPALLLTGEVLIWGAGFGRYTRDLPFVIVSLFASWSYLRFYARGPVSDMCHLCFSYLA